MSRRVTNEFRVTQAARERYGLEGSLFGLRGDLSVADIPASRRLAAQVNAVRAATDGPGTPTVQGGELNALGLIHEVFHLLIERYQEEARPGARGAALEAVEAAIGPQESRLLLGRFAGEFPGAEGVPPPAELERRLNDPRHRADLLEELLLIWLLNANPAAEPMRDLFDDGLLAAHPSYRAAMDALTSFFESEPGFGPGGASLVALMRAPALASPTSLDGQLRYIVEHWRSLLGTLLGRLLVGLDVMAEEQRAIGLRFFGAMGGGGGDVPVASFRGLEAEPERFSSDLEWMPRLVLLAKSTHVWLDQLSRRHGREIRTLDAIPDEELDRLASCGFTGLWLIGLWERSAASARIKRIRGNPDAVGSAYSLHDYRIAADLGGDPAYTSLRDRAWARGIRLASDMVPNHMGIDSRWIVEHPDWFIGLDEPPFPSYTFDGPDLSSDERVGVFLEDHYWDSSDAAVVFRLLDRRTGAQRFIYHGNDGTSFPWNDTAQLDFLRAEVREGVIQEILEVARRFPVIRFDAAMVLAKKHIERLWYPEPGTGGGIPSRAEHGISRAEFDALMPLEFWREVVDRVAAEVPDTLLLAEAFWLLEGYFVRTLGMHRVYNSAFMNMLRDERNAEYRLVVKNTLEFDPEILKRYVNFMNNPDERTAVDQFGKGDKYFGIATVMSTMPGLPMFGHGQVEGFTEKYGMEFRRATLQEQPDPWLVERHEREIFPLLHRRSLFADVRDFRMYDVVARDGSVNEDVFAYSNRSSGQRSLVVYHNRYAEAQGWIRTSVGFAEKLDGGERRIVRRTLADGLGLSGAGDRWLVMREQCAGLEYLRNSAEVARDGLFVDLHAYEYQVFLDLREVADGPSGQHRRLAERLNGAGVPSIDEALRELVLEPVHMPLRRLLEPGIVRGIVRGGATEGEASAVLDGAAVRLAAFLAALAEATDPGGASALEEMAGEARPELAAIGALASALDAVPPDALEDGARASTVRRLRARLAEPETGAILVAWSLLRRPGRLAGDSVAMRSWFDELQLGRVLGASFRELGLDESTAWAAVETVRVLITLPRPADVDARAGHHLARLVEAWLGDVNVSPYIHVNRHEGVSWFNKESFEALAEWLALLEIVGGLASGGRAPRGAARRASRPRGGAVIRDAAALATGLLEAGRESGYRLDRLLAMLP